MDDEPKKESTEKKGKALERELWHCKVQTKYYAHKSVNAVIRDALMKADILTVVIQGAGYVSALSDKNSGNFADLPFNKLPLEHRRIDVDNHLLHILMEVLAIKCAISTTVGTDASSCGNTSWCGKGIMTLRGTDLRWFIWENIVYFGTIPGTLLSHHIWWGWDN